MIITFIRHSKTQPTKDIPITLWGITEEGINSLKELATYPEIKGIEVIYSSLQTKAIESALTIAKQLNIPIKTDDNFTEVTSMTKMFEPDREKYIQIQKDFHEGKIERINEGETLNEAIMRFNSAIENAVNQEKDKQNIAIVSHGNMLSLFTGQYIDKPTLEIQQSLKFPDYAVFDWDKKKFIKNFISL